MRQICVINDTGMLLYILIRLHANFSIGNTCFYNDTECFQFLEWFNSQSNNEQLLSNRATQTKTKGINVVVAIIKNQLK